MQAIEYGHFVRIRYLGPTNYRGSRLSVSWEGWPSEGSKIVRKAMDYNSDRDQMARDAAEMFCNWLSAGEHGLSKLNDIFQDY
jgi:hypothetical protein